MIAAGGFGCNAAAERHSLAKALLCRVSSEYFLHVEPSYCVEVAVVHKSVHTADYLRTALGKSLDVSWALLFPGWEIHWVVATAHHTEQLVQERTLAFGARAYHVDP